MWPRRITIRSLPTTPNLANSVGGLFADAPVRFAPVASGGSIYFGADDGCLYRLDAKSGTLISKWNAAPSDRMAIGNERLISVWPVRGGPVIVDKRVHFTVGVWPFEGTYLTSVGLGDDGRLAPLTPLDDTAPQGYLASNIDKLVIPCGRANVLCRELNSGKKVSLTYNARGRTDHHAIAHEDWAFHGGRIVSLETGKEFDLNAHRPLISKGKIYFAGGGIAHGYDLKNPELVEKTDRRGKPIKVAKPALVWRFADRPVTATHLKAANRLYAHHGDTVFSIDLLQENEKEKVAFTASIEGTCSSMLAADGKLFVVTKEGGIYCFGAKADGEPREHREIKEQLAMNQAWSEKAAAILEQSKIKNGYCLALGIGTGQLVEELVRQSQLTIIAVDPDAEKIEEFRRRFDAKGLYGTRVVAVEGSLDTLRLPPYLANLMVSEDVAGGEIGDDNVRAAFRVLRPYGGVASFEMTPDQHRAFGEVAAKSELPKAVVGRHGNWTTLTREGALPGSADWTHEYGDESNTLTSSDQLVKAPLGVLWFGGPASDGDLFYNRHYWGPSMAVIEGRMFIQGPGKLTAVDVYTGRILWKIPLKEQKENRAGRQGWNFETILAGFHFVAGEDALFVVDGREVIRIDAETGTRSVLFTHPDVEVELGRVRVHEGQVIVSLFRGIGKQERPPTELLALDRETGEIRWKTKADLGFPVVALGSGKLFCFDGQIEEFYDIRVRRGALPDASDKRSLKAIDMKSGEVIWEKPTDLVATWLSYSAEHDVMVVSNKKKVAAFRGRTGEELWQNASDGKGFKGHPENYWDKVIVWKDRILDQRGPGQAYDLESGEMIMRKHPITGKPTPWSFTKSGHHCNYAIASEHLMTFRAADAGFCDMATGGTGRFTGFRSGCRNSLIPANGVLNAPNMAHGCVCSYSLFTSLALIHIPESDLWTYSAHAAGDGPITQLGVNFGGRGDRTAFNGTMWMDYPNVGGSSPNIPLKLVADEPRYFRLPSTQVEGAGLNWVAASGVRGVKSIQVPVVLGKGEEIPANRTYTVRLSFVEPDEAEAGQRRFDVLIQGKLVQENLDIVKEAGAARRILVKEFKGVSADRDVTIAFKSKSGQTLISGVEVIAEGR